ncbi:hypothetical protein Lal_00007698 [Lupinus albus]|nr:hypothetical protein Lal_00007698 [Lupinus albus]
MTRDNSYWLSHDHTQKYGFQCQFRNTHNIGFACQFYSNKLTTSVSIPNFPEYCMPVPILVSQKERKRRMPELRRQKIWREKERSLYKLTSFCVCVYNQVPKTGKEKKKAQPVNKDRFISKMFLCGDSVIIVLRNPK